MLSNVRLVVLVPAVLLATAVSAAAAERAEAWSWDVTVHIKGAGTVTGPKDNHGNWFSCTSDNLDERVVGKTCKARFGEYVPQERTELFDAAASGNPAGNWKFKAWHGCNVNRPGQAEEVCRLVSPPMVWGTHESEITVEFDDYRPPKINSLEGTVGTVHHGSASFSFTSDEPPPDQPPAFQCRLVGETAFESCSEGKKSYSGLSRGQHTFQVKAFDPSGNDGPVSERSWTSDFDSDEDGFDRNEPGAIQPFDCNDGDRGVNPGATDVPENGVDENCDGIDAVRLDRDGDGYERNEFGGKAPYDCDDAKAWINPGAADVPDNGVDENCDGRDAVRLDRDGDGYDRNESGAKAPYDCDDGNRAIHPDGADAPRNNVDENCDGHDADYPSITSEVRYAAHRKGGKARIRRLSVIRPPDGATVTVRCRGKGCTFKRRRQVAAPGTSELSFAADLRKAKLRRGAVVEVWITRSGMRGKVVRLSVGRGAKVSAQTLCVEPGSKKPGGCPAG